ncbi:MAG: hypothetical protein JRK26_23350 [Deltaproteobacteria bacterium]|nr:hypothetical protein [Deltaproteobacteria bacterium]
MKHGVIVRKGNTMDCEAELLIKEKTALLEGYLDATLKMKAQLTENNLTEVQTCINKRQQVIARITKIDNTLNNELPKITEDNQEISICLKNMKRLIDKIAEAEKECVDITQTERNRLKSEILDFRQIRHRTSKYRKGPALAARFVNTKIL